MHGGLSITKTQDYLPPLYRYRGTGTDDLGPFPLIIFLPFTSGKMRPIFLLGLLGGT